MAGTIPHILNGNTPTCVGKTFMGLCAKYSFEKHPHVCGEDKRVLTS